MEAKLLKIFDENLGGEANHCYALEQYTDDVNAENMYQVYRLKSITLSRSRGRFLIEISASSNLIFPERGF